MAESIESPDDAISLPLGYCNSLYSSYGVAVDSKTIDKVWI